MCVYFCVYLTTYELVYLSKKFLRKAFSEQTNGDCLILARIRMESWRRKIRRRILYCHHSLSDFHLHINEGDSTVLKLHRKPVFLIM